MIFSLSGYGMPPTCFKALTANYEKLPAEIQAELPLKQIWCLVKEDED